MTISIIALVLSGLAVLGTGCIAWFGSIRPTKIVGVLSGLSFKKQDYLNTINGDFPTHIKIVPFLCLKNTGARNAIVELIRIKFYFSDDDIYYAYPLTRTEPAFVAIMLSANETWKNTCSFSADEVTVNEIYSGLKDQQEAGPKGKAIVEVKFVNKGKWKTIKTNDFNIGLKIEFLQLLNIGTYVASTTVHFLWSDTIASQDKK